MHTPSKVISILILFSTLILSNVVFSATVVVMPDSVVIEPAHGMLFHAQLFDDNGKPVRIAADKYNWSVFPQTLGAISEDGFFIAGKNPGRGKILAEIKYNTEKYVGEADILVGDLAHPPMRVMIQPQLAVVPPGDSLQFKLVGLNLFGRKAEIKYVRWSVTPENIGKITRDGLFTAGKEIMDGKVIAKAEVDGKVYADEARIVISPKPKSKISGTVTNDQGGSPIAKAEVWAHRIGKIRWLGKARTNEKGEYVLTRLLPGKYAIYAEARGFIPEWYEDALTFEEAKVVEVAESDSVAPIDIALGQGASISGSVAIQGNDHSFEGVHVVAFSIASPKVLNHTLTDKYGNYSIPGLVAGKYYVYAKQEGYQVEWYQEKTKMADADLVDVDGAKETTGINFTLGTSSAITGKVTDVKSGEPIAGAKVYAKSSQMATRPGNVISESRTNKEGEYTLQVKTAGKYLVGVYADGYLPEFYDNVQKPSDATLVEVKADSHATGIDFALVSFGQLSGKVVAQATGDPIEGAWVEAFREASKLSNRDVPLYRAKTDSDGVYSMQNLISGKYIVMAYARDFLPEYYKEALALKEATQIKVGDSSSVEEIDFTLISGGSIIGTVADSADSLPIARAMVFLKLVRPDKNIRALRSYTENTFTDKEGQYKFEGLPSGKYLVWSKALGMKSLFFNNVENPKDATPIALTAPDVVTGIDFYLPAIDRKYGAISGRVDGEALDSTALSPIEPLAGVWVMAIPIGGRAMKRIPYWTATNEEGEYTFVKLVPGRYIIAAWTIGYIGEYYDNTRKWLDAKVLTVKDETQIADIDFLLSPLPQGAYQISGLITDGSGLPVDNALVYAGNENGINGFSYTDSDGNYTIENLVPGAYTLSVDRVDFEGTETKKPVTVGNGSDAAGADIQMTETSVVEPEENFGQLVDIFSVNQNYPNPFNPVTKIRYHLPEKALVTLKIFNILGQDVRTLVEKSQPAGAFEISWDSRDFSGNLVPSGIYFAQLKATTVTGENYQKLIKMSLIK